MNSAPPIRLLGHMVEKAHLLTAASQYFGLFRLAEPYDHWLEATVVVPLFTFGLWTVLPLACIVLAWAFRNLACGCDLLAKLPDLVTKVLKPIRLWFGGLLAKAAAYFQREDLAD